VARRKQSPYRKLSTAKARAGIMSNSRVAWVTVFRRQIAAYFRVAHPIMTRDYDDREMVIGMTRPELEIFMEPGFAKSIQLTTLTVEELNALQQFYNYCFDLARPVCAELDRRAQEAMEEGDDSDQRVYRSAPVFVVRERGQQEYVARIQSGLAGVALLGDSEVDGGVEQPDDVDYGQSSAHIAGHGDFGSEVSHGEPDPVGTPDDAQEDRGDAGLGEVPWRAELPDELPASDAGPRRAPPPA
jgi:hypothetical protein